VLRLQGKSAIITGAGRGIGKAIAHKFLQEGARIVVCDIVPDRIEAAGRDLSQCGEVHAFAGDVSQAAVCDELLSQVVKHYGELDILANNAGIAIFASFLDHTEEAWDRTMAINLKSMFLLGQRAAKAMIAQGHGGTIVNMASTNGLMGERDLVAYNASKGGVVLLTKTMAIELAPYGIRVNCVCPGLIHTDLAREGGVDESAMQAYLQKIPMRRGGTPDEVASLFAYLASDEASFITGDAVVIDGGQIVEE
jgi:3-oxoacyl-[acyl-carrier protein] reductase